MALDVPLYRLFYEEEGVPATPHLMPRRSLEELADQTGSSGTEARFLLKVKEILAKVVDSDRVFLLDFARRLASR